MTDVAEFLIFIDFVCQIFYKKLYATQFLNYMRFVMTDENVKYVHTSYLNILKNSWNARTSKEYAFVEVQAIRRRV